jgi:peptidoglycan hydrolase-like protein with peptidoglycan-binding domain
VCSSDLGIIDGKSDVTETRTDTRTDTKTDAKTDTKTDAKTDTNARTETTDATPQSKKSKKADRFKYEPDRYLQYKLTGSVGKGGDNRRADVIAVQNRLRFSALDTGAIDGAFGPITAAAILEFQRYFLAKPDGLIEVGKKTARELFSGKTEVTEAKLDATGQTDEQVKETVREREAETKQTRQARKQDQDRDRDDDKDNDPKLSDKGAAQLQKLVATAAGAAGGKRPGGKCYAAVKRHISNAGGYGNIRNIYKDARFQPQGEARNFAEVVNAKGPETFGLERLGITNPYDAPEGSLVVVSAGSPGTRHPTAGDITVKGPGDRFFNDGEMKYRGRDAWPSKTGRVLGVYRVK